MRIIRAALVGLVLSVASGSVIVSVKGPVFHWEMAGMVMIIVCGAFGGFIGGLSAIIGTLTKLTTLRSGIVGLCIGMGLSFAVGPWLSVNSSANNPSAPEGLMFWIAAMVVVAGSFSGLAGGLLAKSRAFWQRAVVPNNDLFADSQSTQRRNRHA